MITEVNQPQKIFTNQVTNINKNDPLNQTIFGEAVITSVSIMVLPETVLCLIT